MKKIAKLTVEILLIVIASVVVLALLFLLVMNIAKYGIYAEYYTLEHNVCRNPGLGDGFVCQGICAYETEDKIFVSGYMKDHTASRIYVTDTQNNAYYVTLTVKGEPFDGHAGGIAVHGDTVYVGSENTLYTFSVTDLLTSKNGAMLEMGQGTKVNNEASFVFADETHIYVGEFHDGDMYVTDHPYKTEVGTQYAIVSRYRHSDLTKPDLVYSVRDKVQGFCLTPDGKIVLSTSFGLNDSHFYVYNVSEAVESGETLDGAPVYYLTKCIKDIKAPAMSEGLDIRNGKVITLYESASDKYIYGKFFFANHIVELDI